MTLRPIESAEVRGVAGPPIKVGPYCAKPGCTRFADHAHHMWSRGLLGGPFDWVQLPDGQVVGNMMGLCFHDHEEITNNEAAIRYQDGTFYWADPWMTQPLTWQPPSHTAEDLPDASQEPLKAEKCPTCARPMPRPKVKNSDEEKKPRGTWSVAVPMDKRENGADVIDELLEAGRDKLEEYGISWGEGKKTTYYAISTILALFVTHADEILANE